MNSLLLARIKHLDDLKKTVPRRPRCGSLDLQRLAPISISLVARMEWCWRKEMQARTQAEQEGWRAEEEGLRDALLHRDRAYQYRESPANVLERYAMGLEDGRVLIRLAPMDDLWQPDAIRTHV